VARQLDAYRPDMVTRRGVRPGPQTLADLRTAIDEARKELAAARQLDGVDRGQLVASQRRLLVALSNFIEALTAGGLAPHWQLRAEVDLLRGLTAGSERKYRQNT
jgi:hypothetical protein